MKKLRQKVIKEIVAEAAPIAKKLAREKKQKSNTGSYKTEENRRTGKSKKNRRRNTNGKKTGKSKRNKKANVSYKKSGEEKKNKKANASSSFVIVLT